MKTKYFVLILVITAMLMACAQEELPPEPPAPQMPTGANAQPIGAEPQIGAEPMQKVLPVVSS